MTYRAEIDGLRALAVLPVILFHAGFEWFSGGFVGVDVFFVISGYLITTIIISEMAKGKFSIVNFYERRARRILPALFFVMAACLPFAWFWLTPNDLKDFGQSLVATSTFSSNILFWLESGYFDTAESKPLLHTWSLAVEEQYYILFPIFLMLAWRLGIKWVLILLSIVFFISLIVAQWGAYNNPSAAFFLLPTRGWELLIGVFAAFYLKYNPHFKSQLLNQALSLLGFGMIVYSIIEFDKTTPFPSLYTLIPTIGTGLLIICAVPKTFVYKVLSLKFIVGTGLISYSAYLWHQPLLAFARHRSLVGISDLNLIALCMAALVLAWFSWKFIEAPFRDKNKINRKKIFIFSGSLLSIFILIGLSVHINKGFSERYSEELQSYLTMGADGVKARNYDCHLQNDAFMLTGCIFGDQTITPKYALIGDSHAGSIHKELGKKIGELNESFVLHVEDGCPPSLGIEGTYKDHKNCPSFNQNVIDDLVEREISIVVMFSRFSWYLEVDGFKNSFGVREPKDSQHFVEGSSLSIKNQVDEKLESMRSFIRELKQHNIQVFIVEPIPEVGWKIPYLKVKSLLYNSPMPAIQKKEFKETTEKRFTKFIEPLLYYEGVKVIKTSDLFCDNNVCFGERDNNLLYNDDNHPSDSATQQVVGRIIESF